MLDVNLVGQKLRELIRVALDMPADSVRPANQNAPTGTMDQQFATVLITYIEPTGWDDMRLVNEAGPSTNVTESAVGQRHIVASVQFFRGDALTKATRLKSLLAMSAQIDKMQSMGIGFVKAGQVKNLTAVIDTYWESRAQIDLEFYLIMKEDDSLASYGKFPVSVTTPSSTTTSEVIAP